MKNDLKDKTSTRINERSSQDVAKSDPGQPDLADDSSTIMNFIKYGLIVLMCIVVPFTVISDINKTGWWQDFTDGFASGIEESVSEKTTESRFPESTTLPRQLPEAPQPPPSLGISNNVPATPAPPAPPNIIDQQELERTIETSISAALTGVGAALNSAEVQEALRAAGESINDPQVKAEIARAREEARKAIEETRQSITSSATTLNGSANSANDARSTMPYLDYFAELKKNGFEDLEEYEIQGYYNAGISLSELEKLRDAGFMDEFEFFEVAGLHNAGITEEWLSAYRDAGYIDEFEFFELVAFKNASIDVPWLKSFEEAGYLDEFEFHELVSFKQNNVTPEFLKQLDDKDLLDDLEFWEIVNLKKKS